MIKKFIEHTNNAFKSMTSNEDFARGLSEWLTSKATQASDFIAQIPMIINAIDDNAESTMSIHELDVKTREIVANMGFDVADSLVIPQGVTNMYSFVADILLGADQYIHGITTSWTDAEMQYWDNDGNIHYARIGDIVDWFKNATQSALIECSALYAGLSESVSERVNIFTSRVESLIGKVSTAYNSYINYWNHILSNTQMTASSFTTSFTSLVSLDKEYSEFNPDESISTKYTGASTRYIYSWNINFKNVGSALGTGLVYVAFKLPFDITKWAVGLFNKAAGWIHTKINNALDPNDVGVYDDPLNQRAPSIDEFCYQYRSTTTLQNITVDPIWDLVSDGETPYELIHKHHPEVGSVYTFRTALGEVVFTINDYRSGQNYSDDVIEYSIDYKPYPITYAAYRSLALALHPTNGVSVDNCIDYTISNDSDDSYFIDTCLNNFTATINKLGSSMYVAGSDSMSWDKRFYDGLSMAISLFVDLMGMLRLQMTMGSTYVKVNFAKLKLVDHSGSEFVSNLGYLTPDYDNSGLTEMYDYRYPYSPSTIPTNIDMVKMASGYNTYQGDEYFDMPPFITQVLPNQAGRYSQLTSGQIGYHLLDGSFMVLLSLLVYNSVANSYYKTNPVLAADKAMYGYFIPYYKDQVGFRKGLYYILSDDQRNEIASKNINRAILVLITAAVAVTAAVTINKIIRTVRIRRIEAQGVLDNKMWSGAKLSSSEAKKYFRLARKNGAITDYSSDLLGLCMEEIRSGIPSNSEVAELSVLYNAIVGKNNPNI